MLQQGDILNERYKILQEIGSGGTGVIYQAWHINLSKYVVVKRIKDGFTGRLDVRTEMNILKNLHHSYLPQIYDFLQWGEEVYTIMEFVKGHDLQYYVEQNEQFGEERLRLWLGQLLEVLEYLHSQTTPIFHCDIKPANIMATEKGDICLIDFNISLEGEGRDLQGLSPHYSAPEQRQAAAVLDRLAGYRFLLAGGSRTRLDARTDIYSLGATFYRLMSGVVPAQQSNVSRPLCDFDTGYSSGLIRIVEKAMQPERQKRYSSAVQMRQALGQIHKWDVHYQKYRRQKLLLYLVSGLTLALGIFFLCFGIGIMNRDDFAKAYEAFYGECQAQDYEKVITRGIQLLNEEKFQKSLKQEPKKRGILLHEIAEGYFYRKDYAEAVKYYKEALETLPDEREWYQDCAIALIRDEQWAAAFILMDRAEEKGVKNTEVMLIRAVIKNGLGDYQEAVRILEELEKKGRDDYQVYMYLAINLYQIEEKKAESERNFSRFLENCQKAEERYQENSSVDEGMEYIRKIAEHMKESDGS